LGLIPFNHNKPWERVAVFVGLIILALGVIFLLKNLGVIRGDIGAVLWPVALMALGIGILIKKRGRG